MIKNYANNSIKLFFFVFLFSLAHVAVHAEEVCSNPELTNIATSITVSDADSNGPCNLLDNDLNTRWSADGAGSFAIFDLGVSKDINQVAIAFFEGDERSNTFDVAISNDQQNWITVLENQSSSGTSLVLENFNFTSQNVRYVKFIGLSNSQPDNNWISVTEFRINNTTAERPFIFEASASGTHNLIVTIEVDPSLTYDYTVDWGTGVIDENVTGEISYTINVNTGFSDEIKITGKYPKIKLKVEGLYSSATITQWGDNKWVSMEDTFAGIDGLNCTAIDVPDLSECTSLKNMFSYSGPGYNLGNETFGEWDVSNITNMSGMFRFTGFNQDISGWDVSNVTDMSNMFYGDVYSNSERPAAVTAKFNQDISSWDVSNVTNMSGMFQGTPFDQDISSWNVSKVTDMSNMFAGSANNLLGLPGTIINSFNQDISNWDVSSVTNMSGLFKYASFNQDISNWDVSSVTDMSYMFTGRLYASIEIPLTAIFNQDISSWDVSNVTNMESMFQGTPFDQDISSWNVSKVINMSHMFAGASNVYSYPNGLLTTKSFNQDISSWNVSNVQSMEGMFTYNDDFSDSNYEKALLNWSELPTLQSDVVLAAEENHYCESETARQKLIDTYGWAIADAGKADDCSEDTICSATGTITMRRYDNISGISLSELFEAPSFPESPSTTVELTSFEIPAYDSNNYGTWISGYLCAPETGTYYFWISGDDHVRLNLSSTTNAADKTTIAYHNGHTNNRGWYRYASQQSVGVTLVQGEKYYIEGYQKEGVGGDHMAVAWRKPSDGIGEGPTEIIPGAVLSPSAETTFDRPVTGVSINRNYVSLLEGATTSLTAQVNPSDAANQNVTWQSSNRNIVTIDANGQLTAVAVGSATITVRTNDGGFTAQSQVVVREESEVSCSATGVISMRKYDNVGGISIDDLFVAASFPDDPSSTQELSSFEIPENGGDFYGAWVSGYLCAPETGTYYFWISGDNHVKLNLSADADMANATTIAYHEGHTSPRMWDRYETQKSVGIELVAGEKYYIEAYLKEYNGGDHLSVGWSKPSDSTTAYPTEIIPGSVLSPNVAQSFPFQASLRAFVDVSIVNIYPNPTSEYINIETSANKQIKWMYMYDAIGKTVLQLPQSEFKENQQSYVINISHLTQGVYTIRFVTEDMQEHVEKVIVK